MNKEWIAYYIRLTVRLIAIVNKASKLRAKVNKGAGVNPAFILEGVPPAHFSPFPTHKF